MEQATSELLLERIDELIQILTEHENECYVPLEVAQQLRDELLSISSQEDSDD